MNCFLVRVNYSLGKTRILPGIYDFLIFRVNIQYTIALGKKKKENQTRMQTAHIFLFIILVFNTGNDCGVRADDKTLNRLLNNQAIVSRQIMCVLEKSPCDQLGRQLKSESNIECKFLISINLKVLQELDCIFSQWTVFQQMNATIFKRVCYET